MYSRPQKPKQAGISAFADENYDSKPFLPVNIAVLTVSDTRSEADDKSGRTLIELVTRDGHRVAARAIVRDDVAAITAQNRGRTNAD